MKQVFLKKDNSSLLTILFAGWGMDENVFKESLPANGDFMICYNYNSLDFDSSIMQEYDRVKVIGWSMGVWAASIVISRLSEDEVEKIESSIAINGTTTPIDDEYGIPSIIYQGTIDNFSERGLNKFNRRMCGSSEELALFAEVKPQREPDDLKQELIAIRQFSSSSFVKDGLWEKAIIGERDLIFPMQNQIKAWEKSKNTNIKTINIAHYSKDTLKRVIEDN